MKNILAILTFLLFSATAFAQVPFYNDIEVFGAYHTFTPDDALFGAPAKGIQWKHNKSGDTLYVGLMDVPNIAPFLPIAGDTGDVFNIYGADPDYRSFYTFSKVAAKFIVSPRGNGGTVFHTNCASGLWAVTDTTMGSTIHSNINMNYNNIGFRSSQGNFEAGDIFGAAVDVYAGDSTTNTAGYVVLMSISTGSTDSTFARLDANGFHIQQEAGVGDSVVTRFTIRQDGTVNAKNLPTDSSGLAQGDLWRDGNTIKYKIAP